VRVPASLTLVELQSAFRDIHAVLRPFQSLNPNLHGRRFQRGNTSVDGFDFVTRSELEAAVATVTEERLRGALSAIIAEHAAQHVAGAIDELNVAGLSGLLADAQTPLAHQASHNNSGGDALKLDDLAAPDDNTDLDASAATHGLLPKLSGSAGDYLAGDGTWDALTAQAAGTYSPTFTAGANVDGTPAQNGDFQYLRLGSLVIVTGRVGVDPTADGGTTTTLGISLPVASDLADSSDLIGMGTLATQDGAVIIGDDTNDRAEMTFLAQSTASEDWKVFFMYQIL